MTTISVDYCRRAGGFRERSRYCRAYPRDFLGVVWSWVYWWLMSSPFNRYRHQHCGNLDARGGMYAKPRIDKSVVKVGYVSTCDPSLLNVSLSKMLRSRSRSRLLKQRAQGSLPSLLEPRGDSPIEDACQQKQIAEAKNLKGACSLC
jgi:hypothetical protein